MLSKATQGCWNLLPAHRAFRCLSAPGLGSTLGLSGWGAPRGVECLPVSSLLIKTEAAGEMQVLAGLALPTLTTFQVLVLH